MTVGAKANHLFLIVGTAQISLFDACCNSKKQPGAMGTCLCGKIIQVQFCGKPNTTQSHPLSSDFVNLRQQQVNTSIKMVAPTCTPAINTTLRLADGASIARRQEATKSARAAAQATNKPPTPAHTKKLGKVILPSVSSNRKGLSRAGRASSGRRTSAALSIIAPAVVVEVGKQSTLIKPSPP